MIVHPIKLGKKKIHQGEIRFWESIKLWRKKKKIIKLEKTSTRRKIKRIECRNSHQDERKMEYQETQKTWDFMNDHSGWEGLAKKWRFIMKRNSIKLRKMAKRKIKIHFINNKKVFSQVKKHESAVEKIRGHQIEMQNHPIKMTLCQTEGNRKCSWLKANRNL